MRITGYAQVRKISYKLLPDLQFGGLFFSEKNQVEVTDQVTVRQEALSLKLGLDNLEHLS